MPCAAIIGAGLIGRSWAIVFTAAGWTVRITDPVAASLADAPAFIAAGLKVLEGAVLIEDAAGCAARVVIVGSVAEAVAGADFVQENGPEAIETKRPLFRELDALTPRHVVIASSTSAIVASRFTEDLPGRDRCLVGHPVNPPHLVGLVEICGAPWTTPAAIDKARAVYAAIGQTPVTLRKEVDAFVLNRLQGAVLSEAFRLVGDGVISAADLDLVMTEGLAPRWCFLGPFATIDLNAPDGIADYCARFGPFYQRLSAAPPDPAVWGPDGIATVVADWAATPRKQRRAERIARREHLVSALKSFKKGMAAQGRE